jgi:hypothetical protein
MTTKIQFFVPVSDDIFSTIPESVEEFWLWQTTTSGLHKYWGKYHWVLQTYIYLKMSMVNVILTNKFPEEGIVITPMVCINYDFRPNKDLYIVILLVDIDHPHPYAQLHITHNPVQKLPLGLAQRYMPPWPQIGLLPREPLRGSRFETVGYFGYPENLDDQINSDVFRVKLSAIGLNIYIPQPANWHDFSQVDVVLAIRKFGVTEPHLNKPSLKLYNAWLAGVPAILGYESAYRSEGKPGIDYLEAASIDDVYKYLCILKDDPALRSEIVANGCSAVRQYMPSETVKKWQSLLVEGVLPLHTRWRTHTFRRYGHLLLGYVKERIFWRRPGWFKQLQVK